MLHGHFLYSLQDLIIIDLKLFIILTPEDTNELQTTQRFDRVVHSNKDTVFS